MGGRLKDQKLSCMRQHVSHHAIGLEGTGRIVRMYAEDATIMLFNSDEKGCARMTQEGNANATEDEARLISSLGFTIR